MEKEVVCSKQLEIVIKRLACQLFENHQEFESSVIIAIQPRGAVLASLLCEELEKSYKITNLKLGTIDISFFRDDIRQKREQITVNKTCIDFVLEGKKVILVDDVLYTGRSVRAALTALNSFGRPLKVELLTLVDRRFSRHLPIQPDYKGLQVDAFEGQKVLVKLQGEDSGVYIKKTN